MATSTTVKVGYWAYGSTSYNTKTSVINVGYSSGTAYKAYLRFARPTLPTGARITGITLTMRLNTATTSSYRTMTCGLSSSDAWGAALTASTEITFPTGSTSAVTFDIGTSAMRAAFNSATGTYWYLHLAPKTTSNPILIINSSSTAYIFLTITYEIRSGGTIQIYDGTAWVECEVMMYDGTEWVQVTPMLYDGTEWIET